MNTSLAVAANKKRRPLLHDKLIKHYMTQSFKYALKSPHSMNYRKNKKMNITASIAENNKCQNACIIKTVLSSC